MEYMMKKLLTASAVALMAMGASADMGNGFHTSLKLGYSGTVAKGKTAHVAGVANQTASNKTGHGFLAGLSLGYMNTMSNNLMLGLSAGFGLDTAKARLGTTTTPTGKSTYKPRYNFDISLCLGRMLNEKMSGYLGLGNEFGFGRYQFGNTKDNVRTFSLIPRIGVMGSLQEKMSWVGELGYKFGTSVSGLKAAHKPLTDKKPHGFQAKVGVSYHF
jgi:hypothetical protein